MKQEPEKIIRYYQDLMSSVKTTAIQSIVYIVNKVPHREDGPAIILYFKDGSIQSEAYYKDGMKHREDGPASFHYIKDDVVEEYYYMNEKIIASSLKEFENKIKLLILK